MDFLKPLFTNDEPLTYEQLMQKINGAGIKLANLTDGGYVSKDKFDSTTGALNQQITTYQQQVGQRDSDLATLREQLTAAQGDVTKLSGAQATLEQLQQQYATEKAAFQQQLDDQKRNFAIRERANALHFTSASAKRAFIQDAENKHFQMDGDNPIGFAEFLSGYRTSDPDAFAQDKPETPPPQPENKPAPQIVEPTNGGKPTKGANAFGFNFIGVRPHGDE